MKIAVGNSRMDKKWKNRDISWDDLCKKVSVTQRTTETVEEYRKLKKGVQDSIKDVGGFVGGALKGGRRKNGMVLCRSMLTLDMDYGKPGIWDEITMLHDFKCCVYSTHKHMALRSNFKQVSNVLQEGVDADGGFLVPEEYDRRLIDVLDEENIMRSLATKITTSGEHKINIAATKPAASWIEEGGALSFGDATFSQILLDAHKLHVAIKVTEELLYDNAFGLENYIITQFGKALANAEEDAFLNGDGTGKPTGLFAATGGGTVVGTLSAAIKSDDVLDLVYALKRPYRKSASFIMNDKTLLSLRKLKDNNGQYIWQPSYQVGEPDRVLGYAVHTSAFAPEDAIAFGDYKYYNIGDRGTRSFKQLTELFAGNGMIGYVAKERVDGKLILPEAVQILKLKTE